MAIRKRNKRWIVDIYAGRKRIRKSFKDRDSAEAFECKIKLAEFSGDVIQQRENISLSNFIEKYKVIHDSLNAETTRARNHWTFRVIESELGTRSIRSLDLETVETYKATRLRSVKPITVNVELRILRSLLRKAVDWNYIKKCPRVKLIRVDDEPVRFLSTEEARLVIKSARGQMATFIILGLNTGLRRGEMFDLNWSDIDATKRQLLVRRSKSKKFRVVPINENLWVALSRHPRHVSSDLVFHRPDGTAWKDVRSAFRGAFDRAGLPRIRIHDLRHSFISHLVSAGVDLRTVKELAGHANISTTMRYAHLAPGQTHRAVEKLNW